MRCQRFLQYAVALLLGWSAPAGGASLYLYPLAAVPSGVTGETAPTITQETGTGAPTGHKYYVVNFANTVTSCAYLSTVLPKEYVTSEAIEPTITWKPSASGGGQAAVVSVQLGCFSPGSTVNYLTGTLNGSPTTGEDYAGNAHVLTERSPALTVTSTGCDPGDIAVLRFCRIGGDANDLFTGVYQLIRVRLRY